MEIIPRQRGRSSTIERQISGRGLAISLLIGLTRYQRLPQKTGTSRCPMMCRSGGNGRFSAPSDMKVGLYKYMEAEKRIIGADWEGVSHESGQRQHDASRSLSHLEPHGPVCETECSEASDGRRAANHRTATLDPRVLAFTCTSHFSSTFLLSFLSLPWLGATFTLHSNTSDFERLVRQDECVSSRRGAEATWASAAGFTV